MKKTLSLALGLTLLLSSVGGPAYAIVATPDSTPKPDSPTTTATKTAAPSLTFSDVAAAHPHASAITYVKSQGIVKGYEDGTFKPDRTINRAEFTKIIIEATFDKAKIDNCVQTSPLKDVPQDQWFAKYVCAAASQNIIGGYPDGTFKPGNTINLSEAAKILALSFGHKQDAVKEGTPWYEQFVKYLAGKKALPMEAKGLSSALTRGQMAEMIYRLKTGIQTKPSHTYEALTGTTPAASTSETTEKEEEKEPEETAGPAPVYEKFSAERYAELKGKAPFVLSFHATWCPVCLKLKKEIEADLANFPAGTVILEVDYDNSTDLKKEFGVTVQTTVVVFDAEGKSTVKMTKPPIDELKKAIGNTL